ncbi:putative chain a, pp2a-specific methylesterase apo form (pme) [Cardiosporidium cionae]|uniref:Protein phosphatase methylesterase 1 n=1 Tax=Cardiosporidium cionae TaxID=476202 RepID=A0ABQ7J8T3_9APIC|nr:putative chain a, pp2a-specific methylesterase apo form (pme) [Cardiosporidium cionae]|eukprot:KAF8820406.1 putative chain a, pp2a-specific methylesterase apo form (pme) [Cardiosporidium cionae]
MDSTPPNFPQFPPPFPLVYQKSTSLSDRKSDALSNVLAKEDASHLSWKDYFDTCQDVEISEGESTNNKPLILSLSVIAQSFRIYQAGSTGPLIVLLHGAGHTSLSWSLCVETLKQTMRILAYDCRGHGETKCEHPTNLSAEQLTEDGLMLLKKMYASYVNSESDSPSVFLVGHSMGGAIAVRMAASSQVAELKGLVVIDAVEGTTLAALPSMYALLSKRPVAFRSIEDAIQWSMESGTLHNRTAARLSIPSQLIQQADKWVWRCDLKNTKAFWTGWFAGLSKLFLASNCGKILICVGHNRLDTELTIAHMQGKYQLKLIGNSGHSIAEDQPDQVAHILKEFSLRYTRQINELFKK